MPPRSPFDDIESVFDRMNRELEQLGQQLEGEFGGTVDVDVSETDDAVVVVADLPGFSSDEIDVNVADRDLTLSADREESEEENEEGDGRRYHRRERSRRSTTRRIRLPADVLEREADAEYRNGVLTVTLPKASPDETDGTHIDVE
ncbi:Hsp20/alpha crystallin family protein [Halorarum salinum]|uniref:Hsp20/alpha crystallin family protein n=1 Tax=Halorarum salinum TaxID=2743089 RepID=A0A7D5LD75_9EURY|nr:Hsp20/alpha crystallin family protein [Halobaculum salinum]QLG63794.1 Hsp20/alpha crystallin family protein [Halobaculum salinum]